MLVNINKLKPYRFIEDKTLQVILVKPNDLVTNEHVQTRKPKPPIEPKEFQPIEFELVCNYLTLGSIKGTYVHVHDNDVIGSYNRNKMFRNTLIDIYFLGVFNPKGCVHSQPHRHFYLKQYKESPRFSLRLFIFTYFFILIGAMSESVLKRLRQEVKEEVERKTKAFRKEQIKKERAEQVWLIGAIYVELFASHSPIAEKIQISKQKHKSRELEKELEVALIF